MNDNMRTKTMKLAQNDDGYTTEELAAVCAASELQDRLAKGESNLTEMSRALAEVTDRHDFVARTRPESAAFSIWEGSSEKGISGITRYRGEFRTPDGHEYKVAMTETNNESFSPTAVAFSVSLLLGTDRAGVKHYMAVTDAQSHLESLRAERKFRASHSGSNRSWFTRLLGR